MDKQISYTTINHLARKRLGLSMHEYTLADLIYNLANNPKSDYPGWCYASKNFMAETLDLSEQSIHQLLNRLIEKKVLQKHIDTKHLKVTFDWYSRVVIVDTKQSLATLKKVESDTKQSLVGDTKESLHYKDISNKDNNNKEKNIIKKESFPLEKITEEVLEEIAVKYKLPLPFVKLQFEKMKNWLGARNKKYSNYKQGLMNFVLRAAEERIEKKQKEGKYGYTDASKV